MRGVGGPFQEIRVVHNLTKDIDATQSLATAFENLLHVARVQVGAIRLALLRGHRAEEHLFRAGSSMSTSAFIRRSKKAR